MGKKTVYGIVFITLAAALIGGSVGYFLYNKPHRDVQGEAVDFRLTGAALVEEYLTDPEKANKKYLYESGELRILAVTGIVHSVTRDMNDQVVLVLKEDGQKVGVSCTFAAGAGDEASALAVGTSVTVKGVIRSGAGYDEFLEIYEDVILQQCSIHKE